MSTAKRSKTEKGRATETASAAQGKPAKITGPSRLITYHPEVESHRADYERVAEGLITLDRVRRESSFTLADIDPPGWTDDEPEDYILYTAMQDHLRALFENLLVTYDDRFMRTLYVELRLFYDDRMNDLNAGMYRHRRPKGGAR